MEKNKIFGLVGMLLGIGSAISLIALAFWIRNILNDPIPPPNVQQTINIVMSVETILAIGGMVISIVSMVQGISKFGTAGVIISIIVLIFAIIFWIGYSVYLGGGGPL